MPRGIPVVTSTCSRHSTIFPRSARIWTPLSNRGRHPRLSWDGSARMCVPVCPSGQNADLAQIGFGDVWHAGLDLAEVPLELVPWFRFCRWDLPEEIGQRY